MKKRILIITMGIMFIFSVGSGSPLTDYSADKVALDLNYRIEQDFDVKPGYLLPGGSGDNGLTDGGITVALDERFALQYKRLVSKTDVRSVPHVWMPGHNVENQLELAVNEFNLLYKLDKNCHVFVGCASGKATHTMTERDTLSPASYNTSAVTSPKRSITQIGIIGTTKLADKWIGYGSIGAGHGYTSWEIGTAYRIKPHVEMNISYKSVKVSDMRMPYNQVSLNGFGFGEPGANRDITAKGLGLGLTFKY